MRGSGHLAARIRRTAAGRDQLLLFDLLPRPPSWWDRPEVFHFGSGLAPCGAARDHAIGGPRRARGRGTEGDRSPQNCLLRRETKKQNLSVLCTSLLWAPRALRQGRVSASFLGRKGGCRVQFQLNGRTCRVSRPRTARLIRFSPLEQPASILTALVPRYVFSILLVGPSSRGPDLRLP